MQLTKRRKLRLQPHHIAWLKCHPERTAEWLANRLADNFHVHHVDGDHGNDAPNNLALIEGLDHMLLFHGMKNYSANKEAGRLGGLSRAANLSQARMTAIGRKGGRKWSAMCKAKRQGEAHKRANAETRTAT
jgi:general stress protein YciG